jgi:2-oxoisovalerate dehydrogenase E1 component beta subunit
VPLSPYFLPLSSAEVLSHGTDLTVLSWGTPLYTCEAAISLLNNPPPHLRKLVPEELRNKSIELIDLRTIVPADIETICNSVRKTGRLVIVHEAPKTGGVAGEIAAEVGARELLRLEAPVSCFHFG